MKLVLNTKKQKPKPINKTLLAVLIVPCVLVLIFSGSKSHLKRDEITVSTQIISKQAANGGLWLLTSSNQRIWFDPQVNGPAPEIGSNITATCIKQGGILSVLRLDTDLAGTKNRYYDSCQHCVVQDNNLYTSTGVRFIGEQLKPGRYSQVIFQVTTSGETIILGANQ